MAHQTTVRLELSSDEALVLFELLSREVDEANGVRLKSAVSHDAELWALNGLQSALERELPEPLRQDYRTVLSAAKQSLAERCGPWPD